MMMMMCILRGGWTARTANKRLTSRGKSKRWREGRGGKKKWKNHFWTNKLFRGRKAGVSPRAVNVSTLSQLGAGRQRCKGWGRGGGATKGGTSPSFRRLMASGARGLEAAAADDMS